MIEPALVSLAGFLEEIDDPEFKAGEWNAPEKSSEGYFHMPFVNFSPTVVRFIEAAYASGWVLADFDWPEWAQSSHAMRLRDDPDSIFQADARDLFRLLTMYIRQDKFVEGALLEAFDTGLIKRIVRRAALMTQTNFDNIGNVFFIKLGKGGCWEEESIEEGIIRFGYNETPHKLASEGRWPEVKDSLRGVWSENEGVLTSHVTQIRRYYEADEKDIFITFHGGGLYWSHPKGPIERYADGGHWRRTVAGWSNRSIGGQVLSEDKLSGNLTKVQMFQGTISSVWQKEYLLRRLQDQDLPEVARANVAEEEMVSSNVALMKLLTWRDFELLVDLVFTSSGWRRVAEVGRSQKTVDIELMLPTTQERAFVQVKSKTNDKELKDYISEFQRYKLHTRMFYVWHSGSIKMEGDHAGVTLVDPYRLARMVLDAGLSSWLRDKVS